MMGWIAAGASLLLTIIGFIIFYAVKGAIAYGGKKGAEHVWENKDKYKDKWGNK